MIDRSRRSICGCALALGAALVAPACSQEGAIADNSFLIEEAYNQTPGVVQHISTWLRAPDEGGWSFALTQEWPAPNQWHQLSYTAAAAETGDQRGVGDFALHYRYQALGIDGGPVAFAPRLSLLLPTGDASSGLGSGAWGVQAGLPLSVALAPRWVGHWNLGGTFLERADSPSGGEADLSGVNLGQGLVWLVRPKLNLMLEATWTRAQSFDSAGARVREEVFLISPGIRGAIDRASGLQIVPGFAVPIGVGPSEGDRSVFVYLSLEHPFGR